MSKSPKRKSSVRTINPAASDSTLTVSGMPFSATPATVASADAVRPKTVPISRQLSAGPNVIVHNKRTGL